MSASMKHLEILVETTYENYFAVIMDRKAAVISIINLGWRDVGIWDSLFNVLDPTHQAMF